MLDSMQLDPDSVDFERIRPISRAEYERMVDVGIFDEDDKIELLRGVIVQMSPQKWHHAAVVAWLNEQLVLQLDRSFQLRPQLPFAADDWSEPEPDLAVARKDYSRREHPSELFLVIEVADSTLRTDRKLKASIYADAGVPEYWIVDLRAMTVEVHTRPVAGRYESIVVMRDGDTLRPTQLTGVALAIAEFPR